MAIWQRLKVEEKGNEETSISFSDDSLTRKLCSKIDIDTIHYSNGDIIDLLRKGQNQTKRKDRLNGLIIKLESDEDLVIYGGYSPKHESMVYRIIKKEDIFAFLFSYSLACYYKRSKEGYSRNQNAKECILSIRTKSEEIKYLSQDYFEDFKCEMVDTSEEGKPHSYHIIVSENDAIAQRGHLAIRQDLTEFCDPYNLDQILLFQEQYGGKIEYVCLVKKKYYDENKNRLLLHEYFGHPTERKILSLDQKEYGQLNNKIPKQLKDEMPERLKEKIQEEYKLLETKDKKCTDLPDGPVYYLKEPDQDKSWLSYKDTNLTIRRDEENQGIFHVSSNLIRSKGGEQYMVFRRDMPYPTFDDYVKRFGFASVYFDNKTILIAQIAEVLSRFDPKGINEILNMLY